MNKIAEKYLTTFIMIIIALAIFIAGIIITSPEAKATVKRGEFTSDGQYIQYHQRNDYKAPRDNSFDYRNTRSYRYNNNY